jgi:hypothetical protein
VYGQEGLCPLTIAEVAKTAGLWLNHEAFIFDKGQAPLAAFVCR